MSRRGLLVLCCLLPASVAHAQSGGTLNERLARLREARPESVPVGTLESIAYLTEVSTRIRRRFPEQSAAWTERAERYLTSAEAGEDPYPQARGEIVNRGYRPSFSPARQGYAIYVPPDYSPDRTWPVIVMLHGGSSNGNLFLGVVLGNNMDWERYSQYLYDTFEPRWSPEWIIVAPDGVGQPIWRWMGEQDVLEVLDDVARHYSVDSNRVVLSGLSNGGMGAYSIGTRHAWRFSHVQAMAGAPSWLQYTGGRPTPEERTAMLRYSGLHLFENTTNTDFHYHHGTQDPGPMRPPFVRELTRHVTAELGMTPNEHWYEHGHDLLYMVQRHGRVFPSLAAIVRDPRPREVRLVSGDYRANRQHWVSIERFRDYPTLGRVHASIDDAMLRAETENVLEVAFDLRSAPIDRGGDLRVEVDGIEVYSGEAAALGHVFHVVRDDEGWRPGFLPTAEGLEKRPRLSGPMSDAYHDEIIHVYGTQNPDTAELLERTALRGARGWPTGVWHLGQRVVADQDLTVAMMRQAHIALYGAPGENSVLDRIADQLPIRVAGDAVTTSDGRRFSGRGVGARFVYPNPEAPNRYVLVHTGVDASAVSQTRNLPDFLPDYVIYDQRTTRSRPRLIAGRNRQLAAGYFDRFWRLATTSEPEDGDSETTMYPNGVSAEQMRAYAIAVGAPPDFVLPPLVLQQTPAPELPPGEVPPEPAPSSRFLAPRADPNGPIARRIARLVPTFYNYRAIIAGGTWTQSRRARWRIRAEADCLAALDEAEVPYALVRERPRTPVPTPVEITGPVGGVRFTSMREDRPVLLSCEMAARLPIVARAARRQNVTDIAILSSHRTRPRQSFHTMGMALDIFSFATPRGTMVVNDHFVETPAHQTCDAPRPSDWRAAALLRIACDLARSRRFNSVLTPNYNDGHRNHFHIDIRPDDDRVFLR